MAQFAGRASGAFHNYLLFKNKPAIEEAMIMQITQDKMYGIVPRYGIEGLVNFGEENISFDPAQYLMLIDGKKYSVFDRIMVKITATNFNNRFGIKLDYTTNKKTEESMKDI